VLAQLVVTLNFIHFHAVNFVNLVLTGCGWSAEVYLIVCGDTVVFSSSLLWPEQFWSPSMDTAEQFTWVVNVAGA
jgi:hypothetical protein